MGTPAMTPTVSPTQGNPASRHASALGWRQDARGMWRHSEFALLAYRSGSGWRTGPTKRGAEALDVRADSLGALVDTVAKLMGGTA